MYAPNIVSVYWISRLRKDIDEIQTRIILVEHSGETINLNLDDWAEFKSGFFLLKG